MPKLTRPHRFGSLLATLVLMLPWLNPIAGGPTPSVMPWLVSAACVAGLGLILAHSAAPWEVTIRNSWLIAALISCGIGLLQYFDLSAHLTGWVNTPSPGVAYGNLRQRNQFATLANMGLIALVCVARRRQIACSMGAMRGNSGPDTIWMAAAAALLAMGNAASLSRTGALQLAAILVMAVMWSWWKSVPVRRILLLAVLVYLLASVALPWLAGRDPFTAGIASRFSDDAQGCQSRVVLWSNVLHLIGMRPWTGWGWGELDFAHFMTQYPGTRFCDILDNAHNLPLHLAVELGIPVAVVACGIVVWLVWRTRPQQETSSEGQMAWAVLALIGLHSMLEYPLWYGPFQIALVSCIWILWRNHHGAPQPDSAPDRLLPHMAANAAMSHALRLSITGLSMVAGLSTAYAMFDYHRVSQIYRVPAQRSPSYRDDTLAKIEDSWLFRNQVRFAALTLTTVTPANAAAINRSAHALLHFSPEARVVEKLIDSALVLGRTEDAVFFMRRFRIAYPKDYAHWRETRDAIVDLPTIDP